MWQSVSPRLRNANEFWASATFSLAIVSVSVALAVACACQGQDRLSWAGFAAAGVACLGVWLFAQGDVLGPPRALPFLGFQLLLPYVNPAAEQGGGPMIYYTQVTNSLQTIVFGLVGAILARLIAPKD